MAGASSGRAAFLDLLRQRKEEAARPALARRQIEWVQDVRKLITKLLRWLEEPRRKRLLRVKRRDITIAEEGLRPYRVPMLTIEAPRSWSVDVQPIGMCVVGALGRVDLVAAARLNTIARVERDKWQFVRLDDTGRRAISTELTEDSFFSALRELLQ